MEATLDFDVLSKSPTEEVVAEETAEELDNILDEVANLAITVEAENSILDNMVPDGEEAVDETDFAMQTGDYLELEIDYPMEATEPQAKITPLAEETELALDALIDVENEIMASLVKEAGANDSGDSSSTITGKDSESKNTERSLAKDSDTLEEGVSDALPTHNEKSSDDFLVNQESESEVEDVSVPVGGGSIPQGSIDQLADALSKKIEMTVSRLIEEELSVVVERIVKEKIRGIFDTIR